MTSEKRSQPVMGLSSIFFSGSITISFPKMGLSGLSVQAKIEILLVKHVSAQVVCVTASKCICVGLGIASEEKFKKIRDCLWL